MEIIEETRASDEKRENGTRASDKKRENQTPTKASGNLGPHEKGARLDFLQFGNRFKFGTTTTTRNFAA